MHTAPFKDTSRSESKRWVKKKSIKTSTSSWYDYTKIAFIGKIIESTRLSFAIEYPLLFLLSLDFVAVVGASFFVLFCYCQYKPTVSILRTRFQGLLPYDRTEYMYISVHRLVLECGVREPRWKSSMCGINWNKYHSGSDHVLNTSTRHTTYRTLYVLRTPSYFGNINEKRLIRQMETEYIRTIFYYTLFGLDTFHFFFFFFWLAGWLLVSGFGRVWGEVYRGFKKTHGKAFLFSIIIRSDNEMDSFLFVIVIVVCFFSSFFVVVRCLFFAQFLSCCLFAIHEKLDDEAAAWKQ